MSMTPAFNLMLATLKDYPIIQNMARFYVYELSRHCGFISSDWNMPQDGLYECADFKTYFEDLERKAFLIKVDEELAGFVLLNRCGTRSESHWNVGEFYIVAKFQSKGLGCAVAHRIWDMYPGLWQVSVIPENKPAAQFWQSAINQITNGNYQRFIQTIDYDSDQPQRIMFNFDIVPKI